VLACLSAGAPEGQEEMRAWIAPRSPAHPANSPHSVFSESADVDLFLYGLTEEETVAKVKHIVDVVCRSAPNPP